MNKDQNVEKNNHSIDLYSPIETPSLEELENRLMEEHRKVFRTNFLNKTKDNQRIIVYADGCFDMFHLGHSRMLEQIKKLHSNIHLIVGVCSDEDIHKHKGNGIMNDRERVETVKHCKWVDEVIFPAPWHISVEFLNEKGIEFIAHDNIPYDVPGVEDVYLPMKKEGRFIPTLRTSGISTSDLLTRILSHREEFYVRNLKKGIDRKDMNLGLPHYGYLQIKGIFENLQKCLKHETVEKH